ncbi:MAG: type I phosphomannose isomerase catalytic subunit [Bacteroidales bacterium]
MAMNKLYPMKFIPLFKEKIWGGTQIKDVLGLDFGKMKKCGEAWMLSGLEGNESVVCNGFLEGNTLSELLEVYMGDLVGEKIYDRYGNEFPLLFKWLDAQDDLSVQVHPNDELALREYGCLGKSELWFIEKADKEARLLCGFHKTPKQNDYIEKMGTAAVCEDLASFTPKVSDAFYIPSGTVHALCSGILLAEIQQSSDITYRMYDWDRTDAKGEKRDLHLSEAINAINYQQKESCKINYNQYPNTSNSLLQDPNFRINYLNLDQGLEKDFSEIDSFVVYLCTEGNGIIKMDQFAVELRKGEILFIPAICEKIALFPDIKGLQVLETYIEF